ncbi:hypothetical protein [Inhella proteolytica]|uniref:Solute-binding protein family 3/N-terminal domain-containing protein n=1 Tax=Inhella proteolytica TaxID=2795029 RepID=A0A931J1K3_9BURK|nr:hypothetical protein [Inhella proteolytica]MBH9576656.1 hypothetical protein [Inhella proteolytica]
MGRTKLSNTLLLAAALAVVGPALADCPPQLRISFNHEAFPPSLKGQGPGFPEPDPGWLVLATRAALQQLGCKAELLRLPHRRMDLELQGGQLGLGLLFGYTPERGALLGFPLDAQGRPDARRAIATTALRLYAWPQRVPAQAWNGERLAPGLTVGVVQGTTQDGVAQRRGFTVVPIRGFDSALPMLKAQRFDLLLVNPEALPAAALEGPEALVPVGPPVQRTLYFAASSRALLARHPQFVQAFWAALCQASQRLQPREGGESLPCPAQAE